MNGARIDAWLARHGVWFMPATLGVFALAVVSTIVVERYRIDAAPAALLPRSSVSVARRGTPVPPADTAPPEVPTLPSAVASREGQAQVCGVGWVGVDAGGDADLDAIAVAPDVAGQRAEIARVLASSGDAFGRAVSWLVASASQPNPGSPALSPASSLAQRLAEDARSTADPRVYAMAWRLCQVHADDAAACRSLSASQWARLDDGNALPWLHVLADAARRGDTAGRDEALFRFAESRRFDRRPYAAAAAIADVAGRDDTALLAAWTLGVAAIASEAATPAPVSSLVDACSGAALQSAGRAQTCGAVADLLLARSDAFASWSAGAEIARALGRDAQPLDDTARLASQALAAAQAGALDCRHLQRDLARWQSGAVVGQMAVLR